MLGYFAEFIRTLVYGLDLWIYCVTVAYYVIIAFICLLILLSNILLSNMPSIRAASSTPVCQASHFMFNV